MENILKTRRTVKQYVAFNLIYLVIATVVVLFIEFDQDQQIISKVNEASANGEVFKFYATIIITIVILLTIFIALLLLFYYLIYGLLLRRLNKNYKGSEFHRFMHTLRYRLDEILGPMSIKRAHKESIALHLINLPQFIRYSKENNWPKWLKRKSYYRECDLVFRIFSEASGGKKMPEHIAAESIPLLTSKAKQKTSRKHRYKKRGTPGPAFTTSKVKLIVSPVSTTSRSAAIFTLRSDPDAIKHSVFAGC